MLKNKKCLKKKKKKVFFFFWGGCSYEPSKVLLSPTSGIYMSIQTNILHSLNLGHVKNNTRTLHKKIKKWRTYDFWFCYEKEFDAREWHTMTLFARLTMTLFARLRNTKRYKNKGKWHWPSLMRIIPMNEELCFNPTSLVFCKLQMHFQMICLLNSCLSKHYYHRDDLN